MVTPAPVEAFASLIQQLTGYQSVSRIGVDCRLPTAKPKTSFRFDRKIIQSPKDFDRDLDHSQMVTVRARCVSESDLPVVA